MRNIKVLAVLHMSPPVHGASAVGDFIANSETIKTELDFRAIPMRFANSIEEIGPFSCRKLFVACKLFLRVIGSLLSQRPTVVYYTASSSGFAFVRDLFITLPIKLYSFWSGSPVYFHFHTKGIAHFVGTSIVKRYLVRWLFWRSNLILLSEGLADEYLQFVKMEAISFLPNSVSDPLSGESYDDVFKERDNSHKTDINFLFMANMMRTKGYETVLKLAAATKDRPFNFHFAGAWKKDEDEKNFWNFVEDEDLSERVHYHGFVQGSQKVELFLRAQVLLFPTRYPKEAFPLCVLEALSFGIPVICSDEGALPSIIDDSVGRIVADLEDFTSVVTNDSYNLLDEGVREECRRRYKARYSPSAFERNMVRLLSGHRA